MSNEDTILLKEFQNLMKNFNSTYKNLQKFTKIFEEQLGINKKLPGKTIGITEIMELPEELRKTALAAIRLRKNATIEQIAKRTKRDISLEKGFAEALVAMDILSKESTESGTIFRPSLGKRRPIISDDVWSLLIKDSVEMISFICNMEIEKAEMKILDIDEMIQMAPQLSDVFIKIKNNIYKYISGLKDILINFSRSE
ncbi:MAG: hypothetical protein ACTSQO_08830 [Candidatus Helarchaeota archaeon]